MSTEQELTDLQNKLADLDAKLFAPDPLDEQIRALEVQLRELKRQTEDRTTKKMALRREKFYLQREIDDTENKLKLERENERRARDVLEAYAAMDKLTAGALWRLGVQSGDKTIKILDHQLFGAHFLANAERAILADDMGLGKTIQSIACADMMGAKRVLIITPGDVMSGFYSEIKRWAPERAAVVIGRKTKAEAFTVLNTLRELDVEQYTIIVNYEAWRKSNQLLQSLISMKFDMVIVDEAHTIKEMGTNAYRGVEQIVFAENECSKCGGLFMEGMCLACLDRFHPRQSTQRVLLMTGTPVLNRPDELFPLLHLVAPDIFPTRQGFRRTFLELARDGKWYFKPGGMSLLASQISGFYLRRTLDDTDVVLPPQTPIVHELELDPEDYAKQTELYTMLIKNAQILINEGEALDVPSLLALLTRLRQATVWPGGISIKRPQVTPWGDYVRDEKGRMVCDVIPVGEEYHQSIKLDYAMSLMRELTEAGKRVVVFSKFTTALIELEKRAQADGLRAVAFHGGTPHNVRDEIKRNFDRMYGEEPKWDIILANFGTGGTGLNLTAATVEIILDEEWNPGKNNQAYGRIHRIGQEEETSVHILRVNNTVDLKIAKIIQDKQDLNDEFNEENDTYAELRDLLLKN